MKLDQFLLRVSEQGIDRIIVAKSALRGRADVCRYFVFRTGGLHYLIYNQLQVALGTSIDSDGIYQSVILFGDFAINGTAEIQKFSNVYPHLVHVEDELSYIDFAQPISVTEVLAIKQISDSCIVECIMSIRMESDIGFVEMKLVENFPTFYSISMADY